MPVTISSMPDQKLFMPVRVFFLPEQRFLEPVRKYGFIEQIYTNTTEESEYALGILLGFC